jgi:hypothetical protein
MGLIVNLEWALTKPMCFRRRLQVESTPPPALSSLSQDTPHPILASLGHLLPRAEKGIEAESVKFGCVTLAITLIVSLKEETAIGRWTTRASKSVSPVIVGWK